MASCSEKKTSCCDQDVKEAIQTKKDALKASLQNQSLSNLQSRYFEAQKVVALTMRMSKERSWEKFDGQLDFNYSSANKTFSQTIRRMREKIIYI